MSRNYELMTQLEIEVGARDKPSGRSRTDHASRAAVVPILSSHASNAGGEEMLRLVQRIFLSANGNAPRQVVLCGVDDENGSSSVCARAGRTLAANSSRPVCLVDANVRSPRLSGIFGVEGTNPFSGPSAPLRDQCVKDRRQSLVGWARNSRRQQPSTSAARLNSRSVLRNCATTFEYMLIDAPGTSVCGDAQLLGLVADAAILVIEANSTRRLTARKAKETLDAAGVRLLGTVLCNRTFPIPERLYRRI